jgi:hypothetical protein
MRTETKRKVMNEREVNELPPGDPHRAQLNVSISSLNEAWLHTLDSCVINFPLSDVILPLTRNCFVAGATMPFSSCRTVMAISWRATLLASSMKPHHRSRPKPFNLRHRGRPLNNKRDRDAGIDPWPPLQLASAIAFAEWSVQPGSMPRPSWTRRNSDEEAG